MSIVSSKICDAKYISLLAKTESMLQDDAEGCSEIIVHYFLTT